MKDNKDIEEIEVTKREFDLLHLQKCCNIFACTSLCPFKDESMCVLPTNYKTALADDTLETVCAIMSRKMEEVAETEGGKAFLALSTFCDAYIDCDKCPFYYNDEFCPGMFAARYDHYSIDKREEMLLEKVGELKKYVE